MTESSPERGSSRYCRSCRSCRTRKGLPSGMKVFAMSVHQLQDHRVEILKQVKSELWAGASKGSTTCVLASVVYMSCSQSFLELFWLVIFIQSVIIQDVDNDLRAAKKSGRFRQCWVEEKPTDRLHLLKSCLTASPHWIHFQS